MTATTERRQIDSGTAARERKARAEGRRLGYELKKQHRAYSPEGRRWELWATVGTYLFRLRHLTLDEAVAYMRAVPVEDAVKLSDDLTRRQVQTGESRHHAYEEYLRLVRLAEKADLENDAQLRSLGGLAPEPVADYIVGKGTPAAPWLLNTISYSIAAAVTALMAAACMSTSELADVARVGDETLRENLAGTRAFIVDDLAAVATALGATMSEIFRAAVAA